MNQIQFEPFEDTQGEPAVRLNRELGIIIAAFGFVFLGLVPGLAVACSIVVTIAFHAIRILGPNRALRRFSEKWPEWRRAGIPPSRVLWAFASPSVQTALVLAILLILTSLIGCAPLLNHLVPQHPTGEYTENIGINEGTYVFWLLLFPGLIDILWMLPGGVILDVAQWPRSDSALRRIFAQVVFGLCGCVALTLGPVLVASYFEMRGIDFAIPYMFGMVLLSSLVRTLFVRWQWWSAVRKMGGTWDWQELID